MYMIVCGLHVFSHACLLVFMTACVYVSECLSLRLLPFCDFLSVFVSLFVGLSVCICERFVVQI